MKKNLKIVGITFLSLAAILYLSFLFVLPYAIDLNKFKPDVQKIAKEQTNLDINFENAKIITTPLLGVGIKTQDISVKLPDGSILFSADNLKTRISIPSIFLLTVKVSCLEVDKPFVNLEIINDENFKVVKLIENLLNSGKEQKLEEGKKTAEENSGFKFNPAWIRIKVPALKIYNYSVLVNDLKSGNFLNLKGEELRLGYFNGKILKVKTYAELYSNQDKNITANIDVNTFLPKPQPKLDSEDDPAERIEIPFVNPVTMYRNYDLKANLNTRLKVRNYANNITSYGYFNIDGLTLKVSNIQIPESYFRAKTFGNNVKLDSNVCLVREQDIKLLGKLNYGNRPNLDMMIKTGDIQFNDLLLLAKAFLDSLHIQNELAQVKAEGFFNADCHIKTNFKKLKSSGYAIVKDGGVSIRNLGKVLANANINIKLDKNTLDVRNSSVLVGIAPIYIDGKIDEKSTANINIKTTDVSVATLFNAFAPKKLRENYNFKSGNISMDLTVNGKLKNVVSKAKFGLDNLNILDKNMNIQNKKLAGEFIANSKSFGGKVNNDNLKIVLNKTNSQIILPKFEVEIADKDISIAENSVLVNDKSTFKYSGNIINYLKLKSINFNVDGNANTSDLIKLIGKEFEPFIHAHGEIPVKLAFEGDKQKQTLFAQVLCNDENFITPVDFVDYAGADSSMQAVVDFKPNRIKIKKTGWFKRTVSVDKKGNEIINLDEIFGIDGTIAGDRINLIKLTMPKSLKGKIYVFPQSEFVLEGKGFIFGQADSPRLRGGYEISNLSIPELLLNLKSGKLNFKGHHADFVLQDLVLNGSDIQLDGAVSLLPSGLVNILNLNVKSKYLNVDKLMTVSEKAMKYVPAGNNTSSANNKTTADIPVVLREGSIDFKQIVTGNIDVRNTLSNISLAKNVFYLNNMKARVFNGQVKGNISVNLISMLMNIKLHGQGVDVEKALLAAAGMKDTLSGIASFDTDISLSGVTYEEQMKSLKGKVNFSVKDGQFGPFGKIENLIIAENIRESQFFQTALGGVINGLTTIDTTHFAELVGTISFNNGVCTINPITSLGNILSLHIAGDFDLLKNYADMEVRARMASLVSNLLGPIGAINPVNLINSAASLNIVTAKAFSIFCQMISEEEMNAIPSFANKYVDNSATKFQLVVRGDVAKPLTLIKSFKWLSTKTEYDNAVDYVNSIPDDVEGGETQTIEELIKADEAEKQTVKYKVKHLFKNEEE